MADTYVDLLQKGLDVEVSSDDEGLRGSWYSATVLRSISRRNKKVLIEYHHLMTDETGKKKLSEFVNPILVRPNPPREPPCSVRFKVDDDVDAFHNDGWWEGVVTEVLEGSGKYSVFFRSSREQIEFHEGELRVHREWVNGKWIPSLEPESPQSASQKPDNGNIIEKRGSSGRNSGKAMPSPGSQNSKNRR